MENTSTSYADDNVTREALRKAGSERTLPEIYGLFYGGMAAPNAADSAQYVSVIFDEDTASHASEEDAENVRDNLLSLWNFIARWKPEEDPFYFPDMEYQNNYQGLLQHLTDDLSLVNYFIAGLNLGGTEESDFSDDAAYAMHELADATTRLQKNISVCGTFDPKAADEDPDSTVTMLDELEDILADCIARVTIGLKDAKG
jgi:hypothetical protein